MPPTPKTQSRAAFRRPTNPDTRPRATAPGKHHFGDVKEVDDESDPRRLKQRTKQVAFGYNTDGYKNMTRMVDADPVLRNGGVLPLQPPAVDLRATKRTWDVLIRKWRRALHMFDHVFIDGEDGGVTTREEVAEKQRVDWVNPVFADRAKGARVKRSAADIHALRYSPSVPAKVPCEEAVMHLLRSLSHYMPIAVMMTESCSPQQNAALTRHRLQPDHVSPANCGYKMRVSPKGAFVSSSVVHRSVSPSPPDSPTFDSPASVTKAPTVMESPPAGNADVSLRAQFDAVA
jgi:hypothetical protein